ncbi:MAG: hypothetical protein K2G63_05155 [Oscillospiraceae bacterium]|nr:hypothetical protein [Oscillospiraceae bacterium]
MSFPFRFIRTHRNEFVWTDDRMYRIEFVNPKIQPHDEYALLSKDNPVMYFYYDFTLYTKSDGKWDKFAYVMTYDFPAIYRLLDCIHEVISLPVKKGTQCIEMEHGKEYIRTTDATMWIAEDYYRIDRHYITQNKSEWYNLTVGVGDRALLINGLDRSDILALKECAKKFIKFAYEITNKRVMSYINDAKISFCIEYDRLWQKELSKSDENFNSVPTGRNSSMFMIGDEIWMTMYFPEGSTLSEEIPNGKLIDMNSYSITVQSDYDSDDITVIKIDHLLNIFHQINDDIPCLQYNANQIAEDFYRALPDNFKKNFADTPDDKLVWQYGEILRDRYHMYRPEHGFLDNYNASQDDKHCSQREIILDEVCMNIVKRIKEIQAGQI